ncbi:hypothetical protein HID58_087455 [Brassica napus]|uniref:Uncharacterized protein n=1 Tax=Brassica napus TaxID=3708 RepID=A0ABQ7XTE1_BRANA|nr:hypothetical protein HID58_087455 [Brassica napus]
MCLWWSFCLRVEIVRLVGRGPPPVELRGVSQALPSMPARSHFGEFSTDFSEKDKSSDRCHQMEPAGIFFRRDAISTAVHRINWSTRAEASQKMDKLPSGRKPKDGVIFAGKKNRKTK